MKYLFSHLKEISTATYKNRHISLFLDYDGTLAPIAKRPELANLPRNMKTLLLKFIKNPKFSITIISGRSIKQLKEKIRIKPIALAGNHGLEIESPLLKYAHPQARKIRPILREIKHKLKAICKSIKGAYVEDKGLTLSVHYRLVNKKNIRRLKRCIKSIVNPYIFQKKIKITSGKKVLEVRPWTTWDKGSLVGYLFKREKGLAVYIGDDETDESAFRKLKKRGITIFVGRKNTVSNAQYYVRNTKGVLRFLSSLTTNYKLPTTN